jgi:catechol 2,3-dioxygenase-like lactoylglutathione lyase family enzyme
MEIGSIVWGVKDIKRAIEFWSQALNYRLSRPADEDWAMLIPQNGDGIQLSLNKITSDKAKRHHMDLFTDNQKEDVDRLIALGATRAEWNYPPDADFVVLHDPDGNPFCVVQR